MGISEMFIIRQKILTPPKDGILEILMGGEEGDEGKGGGGRGEEGDEGKGKGEGGKGREGGGGRGKGGGGRGRGEEGVENFGPNTPCSEVDHELNPLCLKIYIYNLSLLVPLYSWRINPMKGLSFCQLQIVRGKV